MKKTEVIVEERYTFENLAEIINEIKNGNVPVSYPYNGGYYALDIKDGILFNRTSFIDLKQVPEKFMNMSLHDICNCTEYDLEFEVVNKRIYDIVQHVALFLADTIVAYRDGNPYYDIYNIQKRFAAVKKELAENEEYYRELVE